MSDKTNAQGTVDEPKAAFSFDQFTSPEMQEAGFDVEILRPDGMKSGMVIRIAGPDSKRRKAVSTAAMDRRIKAGKGMRVKLSAEEINESNLEEFVAGTISWRFPEGFDGPECTPKNVREIYTKHPDIFQQVFDAGNDLANFTPQR